MVVSSSVIGKLDLQLRLALGMALSLIALVALTALAAAGIAGEGALSSAPPVVVAAVQCGAIGSYTAPASVNLQRDLANLRRLALEAHGAALIVLPEALLWGYALAAGNTTAARARLAGYAEVLPPVGTLACSGSDDARATASVGMVLGALACIARDTHATLIANMASTVPCEGRCK